MGELDLNDSMFSREVEDVALNGNETKLLAQFVAFLDDETDRQIIKMKLQKKTQSEIATELCFASQSAVAKRMKKLREKFDAFISN